MTQSGPCKPLLNITHQTKVKEWIVVAMRKSNLLAFSVLFVVWSNPAFAQQNTKQQTDIDWQAKINTAALSELEENGIPSLQVAIELNGELIFQGAYGLADIENGVAATTETKYRTASVSKWMTAAATMRLVDEGLIDLDEPIQSYCPQYPSKRWPITARHLLTHTSGIRHYADYEAELSEVVAPAKRDQIERRRDRDALGEFTRYTDVLTPLESFKDDPLQFKPGSRWLYSSFGYRVLGCVLEGAAGMRYNSIMQQKIFNSTGMEDTVADDSWAIVPNRADGYRVTSERSLRRADLRDVSENLPAGGHLSTATDLLKFAMAFREKMIVSETSFSLMTQLLTPANEQAPDQPSWRDAIPSENKYGYGVMFFPTGVDNWIGHSGQQAGGSAIVVQSPNNDLSIAVMTNAKGWRGYISFTSTIRSIIEEANFD